MKFGRETGPINANLADTDSRKFLRHGLGWDYLGDGNDWTFRALSRVHPGSYGA